MENLPFRPRYLQETPPQFLQEIPPQSLQEAPPQSLQEARPQTRPQAQLKAQLHLWTMVKYMKKSSIRMYVMLYFLIVLRLWMQSGRV